MSWFAVVIIGLVIVWYLYFGTLFARANARRCYEAAAKRWGSRSSRLVDESYRERLVAHVLLWPIMGVILLIARVVNEPVGDLDAAYQMWQMTQLGRKELER